MDLNLKRIIFFVLFSSALTLSIFADEGNEKNVGIVPKQYDLYIETTEEHFQDAKDETKDLEFSGKIAITFEVTNVPPQKEFDLHVNVVNKTIVSELILYGLDDKPTEILQNEYNYTKTDDFLIVNCNLTKIYQKYKVIINFSNPFQNDMSGFYRSSYSNKDGNTRWILTTHFEPIYARRAFPCFDVPNLKALYNVQIAIPKSLKEYYVLCNSPVESEKEVNDLKIVKCSNTLLPMSTYLVAFTVSDFSKTEPLEFESNYPNKSTRKIITHGRKDIIENKDAEISQNAAKEAIILLGKYLEKGYAFEKVDQAGIPDFAAGAMENWGLISFREKMLFFNEKHGAVTTQQSIVLTITHELVHQWFGNLVTLRSWDYIWLNEAFATYLSFVIADKIQNPNTKDWGYMRQVLTTEVHMRAFEADGLETARALSHKHQDEKLISAAFDDISYAKGCSILRMWDLSLGEDAFRKSLVDYIENNAQKTVTPDDLFKSLEKVAKMDKKFFKVWNEKPGYPVVHVKKNGTTYTLTQNRFLWEQPEKAKEMITYEVPITYTESNHMKYSTIPEQWLRDKEIQLSITSKWFIINNLQAGYYRVNYEKENWMALAEALKEANHSQIHELNRAQIINDVFSLARSIERDYVDYGTALNLARYLDTEKSYIVWRSALNAFEVLRSKLSHEDETYEPFKKYVISLVEPHYRKFVNFTGNHLDKLMAAQVSRVACSLDYQSCLDEAEQVYADAEKYPNAEEVILCTVASNNNTVWKEIYEKYKKEKESSRKLMFLSVLGCTNNVTTAENFLNKTLKVDTSIRKQDLLSAFTSVYRGPPKSVEVAFKFLENNFETMAKEYGGMNPIGRAITGLAAKLHAKGDVERMENLTKKIKASPTAMVPPESLDNALIIVKNNVEWINKRTGQIRDYFKLNFPSSSMSIRSSLKILLLSFCLVFVNNLNNFF